jgi:CrcB protein
MSAGGWPELAVVAGGGALGASGRHLIGKAVQAWAAVPFPVGTLCVNVLGCLLFGAVFVLLRPESAVGVRSHLFLTTGLLGGFTTFSTFSHETVELALAGRWAPAAGYAALSLAACLAALLLGGWLASQITR